MADMVLLRDKDPEAKALGGWFVRIVLPTAFGERAFDTDYCRTREGAIVAGLSLAFHLGLDVAAAQAARRSH